MPGGLLTKDIREHHESVEQWKKQKAIKRSMAGKEACLLLGELFQFI